MNDDRLQKVEELFHAALMLDSHERDEYLSRASASAAPDLIAQVRSLLQAYEQAGDILDRQPAFTNSIIGSQHQSLVGQEIGHFKILSLLGKGGMGEVYLAEDTRLRRKVAIKLLPAGSIFIAQANKRLLREARAIALLDHPNICSIYEIREEADRVFIVMQYVEGDTLFSRMEKQPFSLGEALDVAIQIAEALSAAHDSGIIHRDIKPQNVIINRQGQVKVLDFGLAKVIESTEETSAVEKFDSLITGENAIIGTPVYMSPEQARGAHLDSRSDLFSLGALLFECVTGQKPFAGDSLAEIFANIIHLHPQPASTFNPAIPAQLDAVLVKALAKEASERYLSAGEMLTELRHVRDTLLPDIRVQVAPAKNRAYRLQEMAVTISSHLQQSRYRKLVTIAGVIIVLSVLWFSLRLWTASPNQPSAEARQWYESGINAIRWEAYYQATRALERAVKLDNNFALAHARLAEAWLELDYTDKAKDELVLATSLIRNRQALSETDSLYLDALIATSQRDFASAVGIYQKIADQAVASEKQQALLDLGRAQEKNDDTKKATESYLQAIKYDTQYAPAFLRLGILYGRQQDVKKSNEAFDQAEAIYQDLGNSESRAEVLYRRGALFNDIDKPAQAREQLEKAFDITRTIPSKHQQIKILLQLSSVSYSEGNTTQAQDYATQAIEMAQKDRLENLTVSGLIELGNTYFIRGEYETAKKYFRQAIEFAGQSKGRHNEARGLLSLGSLLIQQNNSDEGLPLIEQAMDFYRQGGYRREAMQAVSLLGRCYGQKGEYDAALRAYEQQLELAMQSDDQSQIAYAHIGIGSVLGFFQERYPEALVHFEESYKINTSLGATINAGYDLASRGSVLWPVGRYEEAQAALNQAYALAQNSDNPDKYLIAWIYLFKARIALSKNRFNVAQQQAQQALELAATQFKDIAVQARYTLGQALALGGLPAQSKRLCEEAVEEAGGLHNPRYTSEAILFLAEVLLATGDSRTALEKAAQAQTGFARLGQQTSEWLALTVAAQAAYREGDRQLAGKYASQAMDLLPKLEQIWGTQGYNGFLSRPDIQKRRQQLDDLLAAIQ
jgi:serine/threonine protein kinase/Tfp pilus assembly protein PilF